MSQEIEHDPLSELWVDITSMVVRSCVRDPERVEVTYDREQDRIEVNVHARDRGLLIGREARTLRALEDALTLALTYHTQAQKSMSGRRASLDSTPRRLPLIEILGKRKAAQRDPALGL